MKATRSCQLDEKLSFSLLAPKINESNTPTVGFIGP